MVIPVSWLYNPTFHLGICWFSSFRALPSFPRCWEHILHFFQPPMPATRDQFEDDSLWISLGLKIRTSSIPEMKLAENDDHRILGYLFGRHNWSAYHMEGPFKNHAMSHHPVLAKNSARKVVFHPHLANVWPRPSPFSDLGTHRHQEIRWNQHMRL